MEKRACERIPVSIETTFLSEDSLYHGIVTNLSKKGMCINMGMRILIKSSVELLIIFKENGLRIPAKVKRIEMADSLYDTIGVEILNLSKKYLEFLESLKTV